ncbi:TetR/AcrR family transcriptional regulator [Pseudomonas syringae]|nr:TetR/AcrR family transcriptional regulator [Pseudomonas syringae pv. syringae]TRN92110.1 TetR/AcrR family transcriptional regulator [Pseudomonas syringae]
MSTVSSPALAPCANTIGQKIVDTACVLITEQGFAGMSMRSLAKLVGMHAGSLYNHFPSKKDLLEEVMDQLHQQRLAAWKLEKAKHQSTPQLLEAFIRFNVRRQLTDAAEERLLKTELCHLDSAQQSHVLEQEQRYSMELILILQRGMKEGHFQKIDAEVVAHGILGITTCTLSLKRSCDLLEPQLSQLVSGMVHQLLSPSAHN